MGGAALVAVILLVVILVVTLGGGSDNPSTSPSDSTLPVPNETVPDTGGLSTEPSTSAAPTTTIDPNILVINSTGPKVETLQKELLAREFAVTVTGTFDEATQTAVKAFQRMVKLPTVGKAGPATQAAIGMGTEATTDSNDMEAVANDIVAYLNSAKRATLPKDVLNTMLAFRNATKGTKFSWTLRTMKVPAAMGKAGEGRQLVQIDAVNRVSKKRRNLLLCFTPTKPVVWCGVWAYK